MRTIWSHRHLSYLGQFSYASMWLAAAYFIADKYFSKNGVGDLKLSKGSPLSDAFLSRYRHYYNGTTYLAIIFGLLHRRRRSPNEKALFSSLSAFSCIFDDLVDDNRSLSDDPERWNGRLEQYLLKADASGFSSHLLKTIYARVPQHNFEAFRKYLLGVCNVEMAGRQQISEQLTCSDILDITRRKGGSSVLLYRRVLDVPFAEGEEAALYAYGGLIQLCDDITDIWFDYRDQTMTAPLWFVQNNDLQGLRQAFEAEVDRVRSLFSVLKSNGQVKNADAAWTAIGILVNVARVCLDRYEEILLAQGSLPFEDRKALVIDFAQWRNRAGTAGWYLFHADYL